jgi:hypothetical protein
MMDVRRDGADEQRRAGACEGVGPGDQKSTEAMRLQLEADTHSSGVK